MVCLLRWGWAGTTCKLAAHCKKYQISSNVPSQGIVFEVILCSLMCGLKVHKYEVHGRFGYLCTSSIQARLQLALLYAATGTLLPEPLSCCTGGQTAMQLVDQCWTNQPLSPVELRLLQGIRSFTQALAPGLHLRSHLLETGSKQLHHYLWDVVEPHTSSESSSPSSPAATSSSTLASRLQDLDSDAATYYKQEAAAEYPGGWSMNPRMRLKPSEEKRALQSLSRRWPSGQPESSKAASWRRLGLLKQLQESVPACPVAAVYISNSEEKLQMLVLQGHNSTNSRASGEERPAKAAKTAVGQDSKGSQGSAPAHPWKPGAARDKERGCRPLEEEMHEELAESCQVYQSMAYSPKVVPDAQEVVLSLQVSAFLVQDGWFRYMFVVRQQLGEAFHCQRRTVSSCCVCLVLNDYWQEYGADIAACADQLLHIWTHLVRHRQSGFRQVQQGPAV